MTMARTWAFALTGIHAAPVEVEADLSAQTPDFRLIGLPDKSLGEAVQRVHNACANSELPLPRRRLTINLSPASLPKHGSGFDVAIAIAALATEHVFRPGSLAETVHLGELGLDGRLRPVPGILPAVLGARDAGFRRVVVPHANTAEARLVEGMDVLGAASLAEVVCWHGLAVDVGEVVPVAMPSSASTAMAANDELELGDVIGQRDAVDALVAAAAGGHHVMMSGPPGAGKTMLARRLPGILPSLSDDAALRVASVRSVSGAPVTALDRTPPFEAPHHSASVAALVGGGSRVVRPGAIARAGEGVLFLDEAAEFPRHVLDSLRQPLETGRIVIHRAGFVADFPARFQLVVATNPCPCGNYGVKGAECICPPQAIRRYLGRLSGPLLDRIDIELHVLRITSVAAREESARLTTAQARERVGVARDRAQRRLRETPWRRNADVDGAWLRHGPFALKAATRRPLDAALHRGALTLRAYDRVLRVAWSLADLDGLDAVQLDHVGRALYLKKGFTA
ncbi:magnesium chelatase family protein [Microbacterium endophyticum]|uniref:Magnesium chelatase family protein n=1 Tax=Microbacterium endophyticum TaxID=1526412 RepID=A0A7W4V0L4_9MICO|nr:YifB family Mg chelatase-like AAA ATPase [Microbacterium endophyticum]MBB2974622.1 magnesium chelatase family protein [Microbacterium endophyticum]NIK36919.1 magnesium chelatase family protein [Microbacterium endophyticum]